MQVQGSLCFTMTTWEESQNWGRNRTTSWLLQCSDAEALAPCSSGAVIPGSTA